MEVKFKNDIQYIIDLNNYLNQNSKSFNIRKKIFTWVPFICIILYAIVLLAKYYWNITLLLVVIVLLSISLIWLFIISKSFNWLVSKILRSSIKNNSRFTEHVNSTTTIILTDNEIIKKNVSSESKVAWSSINRLIVEDNYIYIHAKIGYIQIPVTAFKSSKEKDDFINHINTKITV
ncbi:YcxB family protein [Clostridium frigidicarnis]|uniref:YcxB-like C-terminal domain-containing protein n=1 Tax=Clostridium frigidicarnis TaxID=84698 RepID=A0A1I1AIZ4_9CLOT|nr:YcxB family protein [Clostridium frigidicarnis]SFB37989.1 hypothetical protein SAMN04488528_103820 [Clostridium frigidicarnis]